MFPKLFKPGGNKLFKVACWFFVKSSKNTVFSTVFKVSALPTKTSCDLFGLNLQVPKSVSSFNIPLHAPLHMIFCLSTGTLVKVNNCALSVATSPLGLNVNSFHFFVPHFNLTVISDASDAIIFLVSLTNVFLYVTYLYTIIISRPVNCIMILIIICFLRNI